MKQLLFIKLGGSVITDKTREFEARKEIIRSLAEEIKQVKEKSGLEVVLAHGSGSFGHAVASKYQTQEGLINEKSFRGLPLVADAAVQINRIVMKIFLEEGLPVVSFAPASFLMADKRESEGVFAQPLMGALELGYIPVIYGDIIFDKSRGFCIFSAEKTIGILAGEMKNKWEIKRIVYCGDTEGVYDADKKTIAKISRKNLDQFRQIIGGSKGMDVTGGMIHKIEESLSLTSKLRAEILIVNGKKKGQLLKACLGQEVRGTMIDGSNE